MKQTRMLSLGAGVQSTTVALLAVHGEIEKPEHAIFANTGWEPKEVYDHLKWLTPIMENAGIKVHKVSAGNIREDALNKDHNFASMPLYYKNDQGKKGFGKRQCTREYKITPVTKKQRELLGLEYRQKWTEQHGLIINLMGISLDEIQRAKDNRVKYIRNEFPLLDLRMKRTDCIAWLNEHGYTAPRSACIGCPYRDNKSWRQIKENADEWADVIEFDNEIRRITKEKNQDEAYLHRSCIPLSEVDLRSEEERGQGTLFDAECEGMCGI
jgi:hypothetical protein